MDTNNPQTDRVEAPEEIPAQESDRRPWDPPAISRISVVDTTLKGTSGADLDMQSS